jgi:hypothetical protein
MSIPFAFFDPFRAFLVRHLFHHRRSGGTGAGRARIHAAPATAGGPKNHSTAARSPARCGGHPIAIRSGSNGATSRRRSGHRGSGLPRLADPPPGLESPRGRRAAPPDSGGVSQVPGRSREAIRRPAVTRPTLRGACRYLYASCSHSTRTTTATTADQKPGADGEGTESGAPPADA